MTSTFVVEALDAGCDEVILLELLRTRFVQTAKVFNFYYSKAGMIRYIIPARA
ncbi:MAG: hypothetical protein ACR5K4_01880 [Sodalis sp. (in: enterobacteria)]